MGDAMSGQLVFPNLRYASPRSAIEFLSSAFGFDVHFIVDADDGDVEHAQLLVGTNFVFLSRDHEADRYGMHSPEVLRGTTQALCIRVPEGELAQHQAHAETSSARILNPVHKSLAGVLEYTCADPEGHVWTFSSYAGE